MLNARRSPRRGIGPQRGLSLVELMVGVAVGLIVVAGATLVVTSQLSDNRRVLMETQVQQDLRATADIIARELRRSGSSANAETAVAASYLPPTAASGAGTPVQNPYLALTLTSSPAPEVAYQYKRADNTNGPFGYRLQNGIIQTNLSVAAAGWQDLTDSSTLVIDQFVLTPANSAAVTLPCAKPCPPPAVAAPLDYCYPKVQMRSLTIKIVGHSVADPTISRTIESQVRLRNDNLQFSASGAACPA